MKISVRTFTAAICCSTAFVTTAHAEDEKWVCAIKRDGVTHHLTVSVADNKITDFDYLAITQSEAGKNSCSVHPEAKDNDKSDGNAIVFRLIDSDTAVIKTAGNVVDLDLSNVNLMNYCGHSATIASEIRLKKGVRRCLSVINQ